jgi:hypothetical protein
LDIAEAVSGVTMLLCKQRPIMYSFHPLFLFAWPLSCLHCIENRFFKVVQWSPMAGSRDRYQWSAPTLRNRLLKPQMGVGCSLA